MVNKKPSISDCSCAAISSSCDFFCCCAAVFSSAAATSASSAVGSVGSVGSVGVLVSSASVGVLVSSASVGVLVPLALSAETCSPLFIISCNFSPTASAVSGLPTSSNLRTMSSRTCSPMSLRDSTSSTSVAPEIRLKIRRDVCIPAPNIPP